MRRHRLCATLAAMVLMPVPATAAPPTPAAVSLERGRELVQRNCGMCHATGTAGLSRNPAAPPFRDLHKRYPVENLSEALAEGILTGHPAMPEFRFEPPEISAILRYLKSIQGKQRAEGSGPAAS